MWIDNATQVTSTEALQETQNHARVPSEQNDHVHLCVRYTVKCIFGMSTYRSRKVLISGSRQSDQDRFHVARELIRWQTRSVESFPTYRNVQSIVPYMHANAMWKKKEQGLVRLRLLTLAVTLP